MTVVIQDMPGIIQGLSINPGMTGIIKNPGIVQGIIKDTVIVLVIIMIMKDSGYRRFMIGFGDPVVTTHTKEEFGGGGKKG